MNNSKKAYIYALLSVCLWSTVATAFKISLKELNYSQLLLVSSFVSTLALLVIIIFSGKIKLLNALKLKDFTTFAFIGFLNPFLYYIVLFRAYELLPAQEALTLNYTWIITIVIFSAFFLKQKINPITLIGLLISLIGVAVIGTKGNLFELKFNNLFGTILAVSSSLVWSSFWILNLKLKQDETLKLFVSFSFGFVFTLIFVLFNENVLSLNLKLHSVIGSVYIGLFEMGVTFLFWLKALNLSENTAKVGSLVYLSPFISLFIINIVLGENILISTLFGLILIIFGIVFPKIKFRLFRKYNKD
jgi:drug/metabolite transporter (DMT)-like permease